ncbi:ABC transporter permease [uncultured Mucilaginibacter sp.]|uniref:ABC transporter permease n=1 Tax=uncultured Mucilaginibacter sp. TaxID=797541 RepID=UPI00261276CA|nr:ABC transporter permease [uncultured Mucilaginibacter sp.]
MMHESDKHWEIKPESSLLDVKIKETLEYRDLLWLLVRRDFISFYKQTVLGPIWFFIQPIFTVVMYSLIFGGVAGISTDNLPKPLFYLAGIITWNYFSDCLIKTSTVFRDNAIIFGKVYFPRLIMPVSIIFSNLIRFGVQLLLFLLMMLYYHLQGAQFHLTVFILLFPLLLLLMASLGLGLGMIVSALTTKYRDLAFIVSFGVPLLMYSTTVVYPLSVAPKQFLGLIKYNPMTPIIETFRLGFLGTGSFSWSLLIYSATVTFLILLGGIIIFNKVQKSFVDTV